MNERSLSKIAHSSRPHFICKKSDSHILSGRNSTGRSDRIISELYGLGGFISHRGRDSFAMRNVAASRSSPLVRSNRPQTERDLIFESGKVARMEVSALSRPGALSIRYQALVRASPPATHACHLACIHVLHVGPHVPLFRRIVPDKEARHSLDDTRARRWRFEGRRRRQRPR